MCYLNPMSKMTYLLFIIFFLGCNATSPPYKIALVAPLSGPLSYWGKMCEQGVKLRLKEKNIILKSFDNKGKPEITRQIFDKIIKEDFLVVIGPLSCNCLHAALPKIKKGHLTTISLGCFEDMRKGDSWVINLLTEEQEANAIISYLKKQKIKRWALIYEDEFGEKDLIDFIIQAKMVEPLMTYKVSEKNLAPCLNKLKSISPKAVIFIGLPKVAGLLSIGAEKEGINTTFIGTYALLDNEFLEIDTAKNFLICTPILKGKEGFKDTFAQHYYDTPHWIAACGYAAMDLCIEAMKNKINRKTIYKFLMKHHLSKMEFKLCRHLD